MRRISNPHSGFTLVELAISIMIIGLLVGGVLKGRELVENARITQLVNQVKSYQAAVGTFRSTYGSWPGDMRDPDTRLPDCTTGRCATPGNGDTRLSANGDVRSYITGAASSWLVSGSFPEDDNFWLHMLKAGLITGVDPNGTITPTPFEFGYAAPAAPIDDTGFFALHSNYSGAPYNNPSLYGNALVLFSSNFWNFGAITGAQASQIDKKMDDGKPYKGSVVVDNAGGCAVASVEFTDYYETKRTAFCDMYFSL